MVVVALSVTASARAAVQDPVYFGGPVLHREQVVLVEWGRLVDSRFTNTAAGDPAFFQYLQSQAGATSDLLGVLAQYGDEIDGVAGNAANAPTYDAEIQIAPSEATGSANATVTDGQIQTQLSNSIAAGALPEPLDNGLGTIYVVLFPPKDTIDGPAGTGNSATGFCAYHNTGGSTASPLLYEVVPNTNGNFNSGGGCGPKSTALGNETSVLSHEFAEAISDPEIGFDLSNEYAFPAAWASNVNGEGEIADICDTGVAGEDAQNGPWTVQKLWSSLDGACEGSESHYSAPAASISFPMTVTAGLPAAFSGDASTDPTSNTIVTNHGLTLSAPFGPGIASYAWDWGDGSADSTGADASHTFAQAGDYSVALTVTDTLGFTATKSVPVTVANPAAPAVATSAATSVSGSGATLNGTVNPWGHATAYQFRYGTSPTNLDQATAVTSAGDGTVAEAESATIGGLTSATTYYYQLIGSYGSGSTVAGDVESFTTTATSPPPHVPVVATGTATDVGVTTATLNGTIDPDGLLVTYDFAWGTSPSALTNTTSATTGPTGTTSQSVAAPLAGLRSGTTFYYRLDVHSGGDTDSGSVVNFTTAVTPAVVKLGKPTGITAHGATLAGTVNPDGFATMYHFEYGTTASYGKSSTVASAGAGADPTVVTATIGGLAAGVTYHYRLVATSAGGTVSTGNGTFTTRNVPSPAPKLAFKIAPRQSLHSALEKGIKVSFTCSEACTAAFGASVAPRAAVDVAKVPVTLALGSGKLVRRGRSVATLELTKAGRKAFKRASTLRLLLSGTARNRAGRTGRPLRHQLTLR